MDRAKIAALKAASEAAFAAHEAEKARLTEAGIKSNVRYTLLKPLKAASDATHAAYSAFAKGEINGALDEIIAAQTPAQRALGQRLARFM